VSTNAGESQRATGVPQSGIAEGLSKLREQIAKPTAPEEKQALQRTLDRIIKPPELDRNNRRIAVRRAECTRHRLANELQSAYQPGGAARERWLRVHAIIRDKVFAGALRAAVCLPDGEVIFPTTEEWRTGFPPPGETRARLPSLGGIPARVVFKKADLDMAFPAEAPAWAPFGDATVAPSEERQQGYGLSQPTPERFENPVWVMGDLIGWLIDPDPAKFGCAAEPGDLPLPIFHSDPAVRWRLPEGKMLKALISGALTAYDPRSGQAIPRDAWIFCNVGDIRAGIRRRLLFRREEVLRFAPELAASPSSRSARNSPTEDAMPGDRSNATKGKEQRGWYKAPLRSFLSLRETEEQFPQADPEALIAPFRRYCAEQHPGRKLPAEDRYIVKQIAAIRARGKRAVHETVSASPPKPV
jgi:hypothetical protein